jgi:GAF domain-containing protein
MYPDTFVSYCGVPLIARGQIKGVLEIFHRTRLDPEQDWFDFLEALSMQAAIAIDSVESFETLQRSNAHLVLAYEATIRGWAHALDLRDRETEGHSQRVTELTVQLARAAGLSDEQIAHIRARRSPARYWETRHTRLDPAQTRQSDPGGMGDYAAASRVCFWHALPDRIPAPGARHSVLPSRAMGWHRIPARSEGRSDTAGSASLCCC